MKYWLLKSEPSTWSFNDQLKEKKTMWDGVRNYQARNFMMKMKWPIDSIGSQAVRNSKNEENRDARYRQSPGFPNHITNKWNK